MRHILSSILITLLVFGLVTNEASAKRFGGGRSFGVQRSYSSLFKPNPVQNTKSLGQNKSRWGGVLGGLLAGGLLASLFMGHGLTWLILGAALFFIISFLRRRMNPGFQSAQSQVYRQNSWNQFSSEAPGFSGDTHHSEYPKGFVADDFLRTAKVNFLRLQAAYDQKNIQDLNAFTAPEVFAEIKMQLDERGEESNITEVINLSAQILDVSKQAQSTIASVHFTGLIKENGEQSQLDEIWHFRQFENNGAWVIGGIQQDVIQPI